jgi:tetratricopeptide (TPR) repeat protein
MSKRKRSSSGNSKRSGRKRKFGSEGGKKGHTPPGSPSDWPIPRRAERRRIRESLEARKEDLSPAELWELGRIHVYEGCIEENEARLDDGVEVLMKAADGEHPFPEAVLDLSWILAMRGLPSMALPYAQRATELMPDRRDAWAFYGRACAQRGRLEDAKFALERACEQPDATDQDRELLRQIGDGEELPKGGGVASFFTPAMELRHLEYVDEEEALQYQLFIARQILATDPQNVDVIYANAMARYELGQFERALSLVNDLVQQDREHVEARVLGALIHFKTNDVEESSQWYERALELDPDHVLANTNYAQQLLARARYAEAREHLSRALEQDPDYGVALHLYGNSIAYLERDYALEAEYQRRALESEPNDPAIHLSLCMSLLSAGDFAALEKAWKKGRRYIERRMEEAPFARLIPELLDPPYDASLWQDIVGYHGQLGGAAFRRALERMLAGIPRFFSESDHEGAYTDVGALAAQCELHDVSLRAFLAAEKIASRGSAASLNVAVALNCLRRNDEAVARAREVEATVPRARTILGNLLWDANELEESLSCYLDAVKVDTGFLLPIANGTEIGIRLRDWTAVETLQERLEDAEGSQLEIGLVRARYFSARGRPWRVIEILRPILAAVLNAEPSDHVPEPLRRLLDDDLSEDDLQLLLSDESFMDQVTEVTAPDLTMIRTKIPNDEAWNLLAGSLLSCGRADQALVVLAEASRDPGAKRDGDWTVLEAECLRSLDRSDEARQVLEAMSVQPPPLITLSLLAADARDIDRAGQLADEAASSEIDGHVFNHPLGDTRALEQAILSWRAIEKGEDNLALACARSAYAHSDLCVPAATSLVRALERADSRSEAYAVAHSALGNQPGDPDLVEWVVSAYLADGDAPAAEEFLGKQRESLLFRNRDALSAILGERVARARLSRPSAVAQAVEAGESAKLEFKSTLRWDLREGKKNSAIELSSLKTICAFLNTNGGVLLIGVDDDGNPIGIEQDGFANDDKFLLHLYNLIKSKVGPAAGALLQTDIEDFRGVKVCIVTCQPSPSAVYLGKEDAFFVRTGPSSVKLESRKLVDYTRDRFE